MVAQTPEVGAHEQVAVEGDRGEAAVAELVVGRLNQRVAPIVVAEALGVAWVQTEQDVPPAAEVAEDEVDILYLQLASKKTDSPFLIFRALLVSVISASPFITFKI